MGIKKKKILNVTELANKMYKSQIYCNKKRGFNVEDKHLPEYTLEAFTAWLKSRKNFTDLYMDWLDKDCHKDFTPSADRRDNSVPYKFDNLILGTWRDNRRNSHETNKVKVLRFTINGEFLNRYDSVLDAEKQTNVDKGSISKAMSGKLKVANGNIWIAEEDYTVDKLNERVKIANSKPSSSKNTKIRQYGLNGNLLEIYNSMSEAADIMNCNVSTISNACNDKRLVAVDSLWFVDNKYSDDLLIDKIFKVRIKDIVYRLKEDKLVVFTDAREATKILREVYDIDLTVEDVINKCNDKEDKDCYLLKDKEDYK